MKVDLKAHRCPTAQVFMNRALDAFMGSSETTLVIQSIEPSLHRNTVARLAGLGLNAVVQDVNATPVTDEDRLAWSDDFDEEDFEGVQDKVHITIVKTS